MDMGFWGGEGVVSRSEGRSGDSGVSSSSSSCISNTWRRVGGDSVCVSGGVASSLSSACSASGSFSLSEQRDGVVTSVSLEAVGQLRYVPADDDEPCESVNGTEGAELADEVLESEKKGSVALRLRDLSVNRETLHQIIDQHHNTVTPQTFIISPFSLFSDM